MPEEKVKGKPTRIKYEGIFDWEELYGLILSWFSDKHYDFYETKNVRKTETYGHKFEYKAHAEREESGYVRHDIDVSIKGFHMEDIEVIENGEKKKKTKIGMLIIDLIPVIVLDFEHGSERGKFVEKLKPFVHKYLLRGYIYEQLDKLYYEMYKLNTKIKEELHMEGKHSAY